MGKDDLLKRATNALDRINGLKNGIEHCDCAIDTLGVQPHIIICGIYGQVTLDDEAIGLDQKAKAFIARGINYKITARQRAMEKTLEAVLDAIEEIFPEKSEKSEPPYPALMPSDDVDS